MLVSPIRREIRHFHLFCGLGGGARGFNRGRARVGNVEAVFRCLGGVDVNAAAIRVIFTENGFDRVSPTASPVKAADGTVSTTSVMVRIVLSLGRGRKFLRCRWPVEHDLAVESAFV